MSGFDDHKPKISSEELRRRERAHTMRSFKYALGENNVKKSEIGYTLCFDLSKPRQLEQFNYFGQQAQRLHVQFLSTSSKAKDILVIKDISEEQDVTVTIPYEQNNDESTMLLAIAMAEDADIRRVSDDMGGMRRRVLRSDPEHLLTEITERPWDIVSGSPYGDTILEPSLSISVDNQKRTAQEYSAGYGLLKEGNTSIEVKDWLEHQKNTEKSNNLPVRTAIPKQWATASNLHRLRQRSPEIRGALKEQFNTINTRER